MGVLIFILIFLAALVIFFGPPVYLYIQKNFREQKSYERGLKMIPLLIHLPPPSEDTDLNGRDVRDVTEETISKAQIIYNIISSTLQKGFKSKFYGQRHFSFEIVGTNGRVYFYAAVPVSLVDVVKQAVVSAYPTARLEEAEEHNIFNPIGKISSTVGGQLTLKEDYAYPIATYQDLKRDAMQSMLNALSSLNKEDGVGIQIVMRPAETSWRKEASEVASNKREGKGHKSGGSSVILDEIESWIRHIVHGIIWGPLEDKGKEHGGSSSSSSALDQSVIDSIEDKTRHPGFEVVIRVIASSNISQRSQSILNHVVASFALFDSPGKNGFKYTPAKDIEEFVTAYILRFFPHQKKRDILNSVELATIFHFPDESNIPTSQLERQASKQVDGPRNMSDDGLLLGYNLFRGVKKPIRLAIGDRQRHMYAVGQTGTGKSTFLENLALQDMLSGNGFAFVDPHGDTAEKLLSMVPKERTEDVIYFSPADMSYPMGLNLFEFRDPQQKDFLIQEALNMLYKLYDPQHQGIMGPRYEHLFRNAALTIMADPAGGTFVDIPKLFRDPKYVQEKLKYVTDQSVIEFWQKEMPQSQRSNEFGEVMSWFVSKFGAFLSNEMMRNIIGQTKSSFDLRDVMDNKKILLVNLSKGRLGELNSKLLGMIFVMKFQVAAMSRANLTEAERIDFALYVDEFQNFSTDSFATIMSEARKYHLNLIVANQFTTQLTDEIREAVFGNMGTIVSFRVGQSDVEVLSRYFQPAFEAEDLLRLPNYNTITRTLVGGVPTNPFSMSTLPPQGAPNPKLAEALKQLSAAKYGRPKQIVEKEIFERLAVSAEPIAPPSTFGSPPPAPSRPAGLPPQQAPSTINPAASPALATNQPPAKTSGSSFLDEWLAKRSAPNPTTSSPNPTPSIAPPAATNDAFSPPTYPGLDTVPSVPNQQPVVSLSPAGPQLQSVMSQPPQPQPPKTEVHLNLKNANHGDEDGIFIDRSGNIHSSQQA